MVSRSTLPIGHEPCQDLTLSFTRRPRQDKTLSFARSLDHGPFELTSGGVKRLRGELGRGADAAANLGHAWGLACF